VAAWFENLAVASRPFPAASCGNELLFDLNLFSPLPLTNRTLAKCSAIALHGDEQNEMMNRCGEKVITLLPHE
jgi:hypothetical protein